MFHVKHRIKYLNICGVYKKLYKVFNVFKYIGQIHDWYVSRETSNV